MRLRSAYAGIQRLLRAIAMVALVGLVGVTAVDVVGRVLFNAPLGFAYEVVGILLGFAVYGGLIGINWRREHIRIDLFAPMLARAPRFDRLREAAAWVMELTFFTILAVYIFRQMFQLMRWRETFLFLPLEKWSPLAVFGGFAALAVVGTITAIIPALRPQPEDMP